MTISDRTIIREMIEQELPLILEKNPEIQGLIVRISQKRFADRYDTESRFDRILDELRHEREESGKKWEESRKQWEKNSTQWEENNKKWEESWKKSEEYDKKFYDLLAEMRAVDKKNDRKYDSAIGALGARWGIAAESSFRNALKDILESQFDVTDAHAKTVAKELGIRVYSYPEDAEL